MGQSGPGMVECANQKALFLFVILGEKICFPLWRFCESVVQMPLLDWFAYKCARAPSFPWATARRRPERERERGNMPFCKTAFLSLCLYFIFNFMRARDTYSVTHKNKYISWGENGFLAHLFMLQAHTRPRSFSLSFESVWAPWRIPRAHTLCDVCKSGKKPRPMG